ncbi:protein lin-52 homolog isoform X1 [Athene noctua]|uniref:protein lin-52 homolog isoform X1 n=1 Tax=Athene noctua TaxID=126797 RepID=UPI003EBDBCD4
MAAPADGADLEASLLSFEKLDRASPDLWPEQLPGVAEFAASFKSPITSSPPKWMAELENDDIDMLKELGSLTTANLMEKVRGLQNLAYQLGLDEYPSSLSKEESQINGRKQKPIKSTSIFMLWKVRSRVTSLGDTSHVKPPSRDWTSPADTRRKVSEKTYCWFSHLISVSLPKEVLGSLLVTPLFYWPVILLY